MFGFIRCGERSGDRTPIFRACVQLATAAAVLAIGVVAPVPGALRDADAGKATSDELVERRTADSKTFRNADGSFTTSIYAEPVHYRDERGRWREISSQLVPADVPGYALANEANAFRALFKPQLADRFLRFEVDGQPFAFSLRGAGKKAARATGHRLTYEGAFEDVDLQYEVVAEGIKETLVLASARVPSRYQFTLEPPAGRAVEAAPREDGSWEFYTASRGEPLFVLAAPTIAEDAADANLSMKVTRTGDDFLVTVSLDPRWLNDPARRFPVLLDPTITIQGTSQYGNYNFNCSTCLPLVDERVRIGSSATEIWRPALQFNLTSIPTGVSVTDAQLRLYYDGKCVMTCAAGAHTLDLHRITSAWTTSKTTSGIAYDATRSATLSFSTIADADVQWMSWNVTSLVNGWRTATYPNYGVLLRRNPDPLSSNGPTAPSGRYTADASLKPKLDVTYSGDAVDLLPITSTHSNGADLEWSRYLGMSGAPFDRYEVHRSRTTGFTPSASTLIATIRDVDTTTYRDTTAGPSKTFYYRVVANTSASVQRPATMNGPGNAAMTLQPTPQAGKFTTLSKPTTGETCIDDGADDDLWLAAETTATRRALLYFDLRAIPTAATVSAARLSLWRPFNAGFSNAVVDLHRVTAGWEEGTGNGTCTGAGATWAESQSGVKWTAAGGDYDPVATKTVTTSTSGDWDNYYIEALAGQWVQGDAANLGVLLKLRDETPADGRRFRYYSDDFSVAPTLRPKLYVVYADGSQAIAPTASVASPAPAAVVGGSAVTVSAAASDDGSVSQVEFLVDGSGTPAATDTTPPFSFSWNTVGLADGNHTLTARATDDGGNVTTSAVTTVQVENRALPATAVTSPAGGATVSGTTTVSASASAAAGLTKVEFLFDEQVFAEAAAVTGQSTYSAAWNTLDPALTAYDGAHTLTTRAYDASGRVTTSAAVSVTVANTTGTKYQTTLSSTAVPQAVTYDPALGTQQTSPVDVTVKNTSQTTWSASSVVLRYRWDSPDPTPQVTSGPDVSLGSDVLPGQTRTVRVDVSPPTLPDGVDKAQYTLRLEPYDKTAGAWFDAKGSKPIENPVVVNKALLTSLGLESWQHYVDEELGAGMTNRVNVANGNSIVRWTPFSAPGRGLSTVVDLTYNALEKKCECPAGNNWSLGISSLTRFGLPIDVHPNKADELANRSKKWIELTDADGTTHRFDGFTAADGKIYWTEPPGVHVYLREYSTTDTTRKWAFTTPDRVTYFYDVDGYPTSVEDKNGNRLTFTLETVPPAEDPGGPKKRITKVTDAGGRSFTISYWSKAEVKKAHMRGRVKDIVDHGGHAIHFDYYEDGNLLRLTQRGGTNADGSFLADRSFVFTYTTSDGSGPALPNVADRANPPVKVGNQSTRLYSIRDPRGNETTFAYLGPGNGVDRWKLASRTNRAAAVTSFAYDITNRVTTVTAPLSRVSKYAYDTEGKVTGITNPLNQTTTQTWSADRMLTKITEPTGRFVEFAYNDNGLKTDEWDQLRNRTAYEYENVAVDANDVSGKWKAGRVVPHISQLKTRTTPKGTATATPTTDYQTSYVYDAKGNLTRITDPQGFVTTYTYNADGTKASLTDANNHTTTFVAYDANGLPSEVRDASGRTTRFGHDADGLLVWVQDPLHADDTGTTAREYRTYLDYDSFHRLGRQSEPKSTSNERGILIWRGTAYDPNDNVVSHYAPAYGQQDVKGPRTTLEYDAMDRLTAEIGPDPSVGQERTESAYDAAGRLTRVTRPLGVASVAIANDYVTEIGYDALDRITKETRYPKDGSAAEARVTNYCYDLAGDLRSVTAPRGVRSDAPISFTSCPPESAPSSYTYTPASYTTKYAYDAAHRLQNTTDPLGNTASATFDANGNLESATDEESNSRRYSYNARDELIEAARPFDPARPARKLITKYEYDGNGNVAREISPRAVDSQGAGPYTHYVTTYVYDTVDQLTTIKHAIDGSTRQAWTHYGYNANGNVVSASLPVDTDNAALVGSNQQTRVTYDDTAWIRTIDFPDRGVTTFDYTAQGWQASRKPAGGPEETWTYYDDGGLKENTDPNGHPNTFTYDLDNNLIRTDDASGVDDAAEAPLVVEQDYNGFDEPTEIRQRKEPPGQTPPPWRVTTYAYDANGNLQERVDEGRTQTFAYDQADRFISQLDANGAGCGDDRQLRASYLRNGWVAGEVVRRSDGGCDPATWPIKRQTAQAYFANGDLQLLQTWKGDQAPVNLVESHTLEYERDGIYLNGHRAKDTFTLQGAQPGPCQTSSCAATFAYDARARLTQWANGEPGADESTTAYSLDPDTSAVDTLEGNVVKEIVSGAGARMREYTYNRAGQLQTLSVGGALAQLYFWDAKSGNIRCVTEPGYTAALCDGDGTAKPGLRDWYKFDPLDRLKVFKSHRSASIDSSYVYDAFDRVSTERESHSGGPARTTEFAYLGITGDVSAETQKGSSPSTKRYSYDVNDKRVGVQVTASSPQDYSFARNPRGDISLLADDSGVVAASYAYKPYGDLDLSVSRGDLDKTNPFNPFRFNDYRFDSGSRSIDMGARRYEPDDGRFLEQDFLRESDEELELSLDSLTQSRYGFAGGNPVTHVEIGGHVVIPNGGGAPPPPPSPRARRISFTFNFFINSGLVRFPSAGLVGNFLHETGGTLDPRTRQFGGGPGRGIAQWEVGGRWDTLLRFARQRNISPWSLRTQARFVWYELHTTERFAWTKLLASRNVTQAAIAVEVYYERPNPLYANRDARVRYAKYVLANF